MHLEFTYKILELAVREPRIFQTCFGSVMFEGSTLWLHWLLCPALDFCFDPPAIPLVTLSMQVEI